MKYGALGQAEAQLAVAWRIEPQRDGEQPRLHIDWRETGVVMPPPGAIQQGGGQGRELIERALPYQLSARTTYVLDSDGVHCTISVPISATNGAIEGTMAEPGLQNCRILVVEDEYYLAEELTQELADAGALVLGPAPSIERALKLLEPQSLPDGAILDVNLGGEPVFPLADTLIDRGVPLIFTTGYDPTTLPERFAHITTCEKPINVARITAAIGRAIHA